MVVEGVFAGIYTFYMLLENGQLFKKDGKKGSKFQEIEGITKKEAKSYFEQVETLQLQNKKN